MLPAGGDAGRGPGLTPGHVMPARVLVRVVIVGSLAAALLLVIAGGALALAGHRVSGSSMEPTLVDGELFAANPFDHRPARFDVVLLKASESVAGDQELVKRVIGLPGDRIEIVAASGVGGPTIRVSPAGSTQWSEVSVAAVNPREADGSRSGAQGADVPGGEVHGSGVHGSGVHESRVHPQAGPRPWRTRIECCTSDGRTSTRSTPATVPPGRYFVLGDNRDASIDSRTFGFTAPGSVRGIVVGRLWPPDVLSGSDYRLEPEPTKR